jgi:hypothetical protein
MKGRHRRGGGADQTRARERGTANAGRAWAATASWLRVRARRCYPCRRTLPTAAAAAAPACHCALAEAPAPPRPPAARLHDLPLAAGLAGAGVGVDEARGLAVATIRVDAHRHPGARGRAQHPVAHVVAGAARGGHRARQAASLAAAAAAGARGQQSAAAGLSGALSTAVESASGLPGRSPRAPSASFARAARPPARPHLDDGRAALLHHCHELAGQPLLVLREHLADGLAADGAVADVGVLRAAVVAPDDHVLDVGVVHACALRDLGEATGGGGRRWGRGGGCGAKRAWRATPRPCAVRGGARRALGAATGRAAYARWLAPRDGGSSAGLAWA